MFGFAKMMLSNNPFMQSKDLAGMMIWMALFGLGIELQLGAARIFGIERKGLTLSSLVTMPVPLGRIVRQKVIGCLASLIPGMCFVALGLAMNPEYVDAFLKTMSRGGRGFLGLRLRNFKRHRYAPPHLLALAENAARCAGVGNRDRRHLECALRHGDE